MWGCKLIKFYRFGVVLNKINHGEKNQNLLFLFEQFLSISSVVLILFLRYNE
jgi:hypothetical protein